MLISRRQFGQEASQYGLDTVDRGSAHVFVDSVGQSGVARDSQRFRAKTAPDKIRIELARELIADFDGSISSSQ